MSPDFVIEFLSPVIALKVLREKKKIKEY